MFFHSFIAMEYAFTLFNAACDHLAGRSFMEKEQNQDFSSNYVISLCGVVVRRGRVEPRVQGSSPTEFLIPSFFFFPVFCVVVFYKYIAK